MVERQLRCDLLRLILVAGWFVPFWRDTTRLLFRAVLFLSAGSLLRSPSFPRGRAGGQAREGPRVRGPAKGRGSGPRVGLSPFLFSFFLSQVVLVLALYRIGNIQKTKLNDIVVTKMVSSSSSRDRTGLGSREIHNWLETHLFFIHILM